MTGIRCRAIATVAGLAALLTGLVLGGCAAPPTGGDEIRTASDQSDGEKRARVRLELASAYFGRGQANTALDEVKQALAAKPDLPEAFNLRGLIYASLGEVKLAEDSFKRALQLRAKDVDTLHNYGWFLCQLRRYDEAEAQFQLALAQPQYLDAPRSLFALGVCQARQGRWAEAEASLSRSYELDPANPGTALNLSEVLYRRGEYERARFYIRRVNAVSEQSNAQSLWLAARIERRLGNMAGVGDFGRQLRDRFPDSTEALRYQRGQFDE